MDFLQDNSFRDFFDHAKFYFVSDGKFLRTTEMVSVRRTSGSPTCLCNSQVCTGLT